MDCSICKERPKRRIVCAALKSKVSGRVICGARHFDKTMLSQITHSGGRIEWTNAEQGFIDQFSVFVSRQEAWKIAEAAGQILRRCGGDGKSLYSENLY